jgi:ketosteroid isomerase-like protein
MTSPSWNPQNPGGHSETSAVLSRPTRRSIPSALCVGPGILVLSLVCCLLADPGSIFGRTSDESTQPLEVVLTEEEGRAAELSIRQTLDDQVRGWNAGDIPKFMDGYVRGEELRFASGGSVRQGWQETLERYRKNYSSRELMGTLAFSELQILVISKDYAEVFGEFHLTRGETIGDAKGLFTLLMRREGERWLVLHDHTSSAD